LLFRFGCKLFNHIITAFLIGFKVTFKDVREKENLEYGKHYKEFDKDYYPKGSTNGHALETLVVETEYPFKYVHDIVL